MSEPETIRITQIDEILTPPDPNVDQARAYVEAMVDDEDINLGILPPDELDRLKLHFIGWKHTIDNAEALAREVIRVKPDILIFETVGGGTHQRKQEEIVHNLLIQDVPVLVRSADSDVTIQPQISTPAHNEIESLSLLVKSAGIHPIFRKMDVSDEQAELRGVNHEPIPLGHTGELVLDPDWYLFDKPKYLLRELDHLLHLDAEEDIARESTMINDVSRISANALTKLPGDVKVMVCFGSVHTNVARYFQKKGFNATFDILDPVTKSLTKRHTYSFYHRATREGVIMGQISDINVRNFALVSLIEPIIAYKMRQADAVINIDEAYRKAMNVEKKIIENDSEEIWKSWQKIYSRRLLGRSMKDKTVLAFEELLAAKVEESLEEGERG